MRNDIEPVDVSPDEAHCRYTETGVHCEHWWNGGACCACKAPAMQPPQRRSRSRDEARRRDEGDS